MQTMKGKSDQGRHGPLTNLLDTTTEPAHDKTNKMACAPSEDSDQPGHPPSLIRVFAVRSIAKDPSYLHADSEDWSEWVDAQADLNLRWTNMQFCRFCHAPAQFILQKAKVPDHTREKYISKLEQSMFAYILKTRFRKARLILLILVLLNKLRCHAHF